MQNFGKTNDDDTLLDSDLDSLEDNIADIDYDVTDKGGVGNTKKQPLPIEKKKQSIQLMYHFFTWNNYPLEWKELIFPFLKSKCEKYALQLEVGEEDGTPHVQGSLKLKKKARWESFGLPNTIHWEKTKNPVAAFDYCLKKQTRDGNDNFWFYPVNLIPRKLILIEKLRDWQQTVCELIDLDPDDRTINWVYDSEGCMGKTVFSKYLFAKKKAIIATGGGNKDIACLLAMLVAGGRDLNEVTTFVFNFPRSTEGVSYKAIESVKDGLMTSVKYESSTLVFNCPHLWVFSNELPNISKLSMDRWKVWTIKDEKLVVYNPLTYMASPTIDIVGQLDMMYI